MMISKNCSTVPALYHYMGIHILFYRFLCVLLNLRLLGEH